MSKNFLFLILLLGCFACDPVSYDVNSLNAYVNEESNGLIKGQSRKGYDLQLYNRPRDLWVAQELRGEWPTDSLVQKYRDRYDDYLYFILKISKEGKEALYTSRNQNTFSELLQTLSFRMGAFTQMVTSEKDTIPLADSHYSRFYGQSGGTSVMLAFDKASVEDSEWVQVNLADLGLNIGTTRYRFLTKELLNAPQIDFNQTD